MCSALSLAQRTGMADSVEPYAEQLNFTSAHHGDNIGAAAAVAGQWAYVGAPGDGHSAVGNVVGAGSVHRLRLDGTPSINAQTLVAPDPTANAAFGSALAASGNYLLVGAPGASFERGSAYLYVGADAEVMGFGRQLNDPSGQVGAHFGSAVAILGTRAVVGARGIDSYPAGTWTSADNGYAYVFDLETGAQLARLSPAQGTNVTLAAPPSTGCFAFGASVAMAQGVIVVGAPRARSPCGSMLPARAGAAFTFDAATFRQTNRLLPPDAARDARFGSTVVVHVSADDGRVVILAAAPTAGAGGAVYAIGPARIDQELLSDASSGVGTGWATRRTAPDFGSAVRYGHALSLEPSSGLALVAAPHAFSAQGADTGAASLERDWMSSPQLPPPPPPAVPPPPPAPPSAPSAARRQLAASAAAAAAGSSASASATTTTAHQVAERNLWGPSADPGCQFGSSTALGSSGVALVGAVGFAQPSGNVTGTAYVFWPRLLPKPPPGMPPSPPAPAAPQPPSAPPLSGPIPVIVIGLGAGAGVCMITLLAGTLGLYFCGAHARGKRGGPRVEASPAARRTRSRMAEEEAGYATPGMATPGYATSGHGGAPPGTPGYGAAPGHRHVGRVVLIHGLQSKPELNGMRATLLSFDMGKQRWNVAVHAPRGGGAGGGRGHRRVAATEHRPADGRREEGAATVALALADHVQGAAVQGGLHRDRERRGPRRRGPGRRGPGRRGRLRVRGGQGMCRGGGRR